MPPADERHLVLNARRLRVLLLADQCNPEWPSLPIVGYKYAVALSEFCDVVVATQIRNEENIRKLHPADSAPLQFQFIDTEYVARPLHRAATVIRGNAEVAWSTGMAMSYLPYIEFERRAWQRFRRALDAGELDLVHRITPMSPTMPSWMAGRPHQPFVIGPLNGNLDWPAAFTDEQRREKERLRPLRNVARHLPFARRTWRNADRVLAAFKHTADDLDMVEAERLVMMPEVGIDDSIFYPSEAPSRDEPGVDAPLTFLFAGRLVPYKLAEVAIRAFLSSAALSSHHYLRIVGDGPERERLETLVRENNSHGRVTFEGRQDQIAVADTMRQSDIFVFPSIRELGAGVVVEAMACGLVCVVVDYGGPADLIADDRGYKIDMAPLEELVVSFRTTMEQIADRGRDSRYLALRQASIDHAFANYRWRRKAELTTEVYDDVLTAGPTPR